MDRIEIESISTLDDAIDVQLKQIKSFKLYKRDLIVGLLFGLLLAGVIFYFDRSLQERPLGLIFIYLIYSFLFLILYRWDLKNRVKKLLKESRGDKPIKIKYIVDKDEISYIDDKLKITKMWSDLDKIEPFDEKSEYIDIFFKDKSLFRVPLKDFKSTHTKEEILDYFS